MKKFIFAALLGLCGMASAQQIVLLPIPPGVTQIPGHQLCAGAKFNADSSVLGACRTIRAGACSGRGCQPVTYTTTYIANWDAEGNGVSAEACSLLRHHLPQANQITYLNGHTAADCPNVNLQGTGTTIMLPSFFDPSQLAPYYYVATDSVTGNVLANENWAGFLYLAGPTTDAPGKFY